MTNRPARLLADGVTQAGGRAWRYRFAWKSAHLGAFHALDLPFSFGTLDVADWRDVAAAHDPGADELSAAMRTAWAEVARGGSPPGWAAHDPDDPVLTRLGTSIETTTDPTRSPPCA